MDLSKRIGLAVLLFPSVSAAGEWEFGYSASTVGMYGVMEEKEKNNAKVSANRWVNRTDLKLKADYKFSSSHHAGIESSNALIFKGHDKSRRNGEWRIYPHIYDKSALGTFSAGITYNVAHALHQGAKDLTFLSLDATNLTYFLPNPNWNNGTKSVKFATAKSTAIMNDGRAFKFNYFTPEMHNTIAGFSYTPDNAQRRAMVSRYTDYETTQDGYTFAIKNRLNFGEYEWSNSLGYGIYNRTDKVISWGTKLRFGNYTIAGAFQKSYIDGNKNPISTTAISPSRPAYYDNYREGYAFNAAVGYETGKFKTNLGILYSQAENSRHNDTMYLWSNTYQLTPHLQLIGVGAWLNAKGANRLSADNNRGAAFISGLKVSF